MASLAFFWPKLSVFTEMKASKNDGAQRKISSGQAAEKLYRLSSKRLSSIFNVNDLPIFKRSLNFLYWLRTVYNYHVSILASRGRQKAIQFLVLVRLARVTLFNRRPRASILYRNLYRNIYYITYVLYNALTLLIVLFKGYR